MFRFVHLTPDAVDHHSDTLRGTDGLMIPHGFIGGFPHSDLWQDRWVVVGHKTASTLQDLQNARWVLTYQSHSAFTSVSRQLRQLGVVPHVEAVVEGFLTIPYLLDPEAGFGFLQYSAARRLAEDHDLEISRIPFPITALRQAFWWHPRLNEDPGHIWMRGVLQEAAAQTRVLLADPDGAR